MAAGHWGYAEVEEVLAGPGHDRHKEMLEWLDLDSASDFNPTDVAVDAIDEELAVARAGR